MFFTLLPSLKLRQGRSGKPRILHLLCCQGFAVRDYSLTSAELSRSPPLTPRIYSILDFCNVRVKGGVGSSLKPEGIIEFYDEIRARGTIAILIIREVVINHQVEVTAGFREKVQSAMNAQVL